ncbi:MAG: Rrf2 family transcriptional regulator [Gammaproteobacteria bacterium]|nr:Rrf2 family transcriptional regulator [Gammaproteobacteria bacterium]
MQLTLYTDYSLRVLIYLGIRPGMQATITEIAQHYKISRNHLVKVVHNLGSLEYIRTVRGRGGGLVLAREAKEINIGAVVRKTEPNFDLVECFDLDHNTCPIAPACKLIRPLKLARDAFLHELDKYTLGDVVGNRRELAVHLKIKLDD